MLGITSPVIEPTVTLPLSRLLRPPYLLLGIALICAVAFGLIRPLFGTAVSIVSPTQGPAIEAVYATGIAEPVEQAKVAPILAARMLRILKRDGDTVQAGETLAELDAREAQGNTAQQIAKRDYLRDELKRQQALVAKSFVSASTLDKLQSDLKQAEASLAASSRPLAETRLKSPLTGIVLRQDGEAGEMLTAGQTVFWVGKLRPLRITADVDEEDILRIQPGQKALLKADGLPGQALPATVSDITEKGDSLNKNYRVRLALPDDTPLKTGMTVEVNIVIAERANTWLVPSASLKGEQLWVAEGGKAQLKPVKTGVRGQDKTEIVDGVNAETRVILNPAADLHEGQSVRLR